MDAKGFVVPPGGGSIVSMAPGRSAALKLLGREAGDSIMLFEEPAPAGNDPTFHPHRDSDLAGVSARMSDRSVGQSGRQGCAGMDQFPRLSGRLALACMHSGAGS